MKEFYLKWSGTEFIKKIKAKKLSSAKILFAKSENCNPLLVMDRITHIRKPTASDIRLAQIREDINNGGLK